jgi:integrase
MAKRGLNIHKRKDGRWEGRYKKCRNSKGAIIYGYVYGKTYTEVKEKLFTASIYGENKPDDCSQKHSFYFRDVLNLWMEHNNIKHKGATIAKYQFMIDKHILPELGDVLLSQINATMINKYLAEKLENGRLDNKGGLSVSYVRTISIVINSVIQFAVNEDLCQEFKSRINKPSINKSELQILNLEDQKKLELFASKSIDTTCIGVMLSLNAGMRLGEVCALTWDDVDLKNKIIYVRHTVSRVNSQPESQHKTHLIIDEPKTKSSARDIPISSALYPVLIKAKSNSKK